MNINWGGIKMVSWTCPKCNGKGTEEVLIIRGSDVEKRSEACRDCNGKGEQSNRY